MLSNYASLLLIKLKNLTTNNGMCSVVGLCLLLQVNYAPQLH